MKCEEFYLTFSTFALIVFYCILQSVWFASLMGRKITYLSCVTMHNSVAHELEDAKAVLFADLVVTLKSTTHKTLQNHYQEPLTNKCVLIDIFL